MKKTLFILFSLLIAGTAGLIIPQTALAFGCTSNGQSIGGSGTYTVPIDVTLTKTTSQVTLTDLSTYTTCYGQTGYTDALHTTSASISPSLTALGYTGNIDIQGAVYTMPIGQLCIWPDATCSTNYPNMTYTPLKVKIGMQRLVMVNGTGTTIPAGTEIARLAVEQRSNNGVAGQVIWGWPKTWVFTLKNALVIPAYTCSWTDPNQTVVLPPVLKKDLINNGAGSYPITQPFKFNLTCDPQTTVNIKFDGTVMPNTTDVLANTSAGNNSVGVQIIYNSAHIVFGQTLQVITNSLSQETLTFLAGYYYNGGTVSAGPVNAVSTVTLTYN